MKNDNVLISERIKELKKRIEELEGVLLEIEAIMYRNDVEWGTSEYDFIMKEIERVKENKK